MTVYAGIKSFTDKEIVVLYQAAVRSYLEDGGSARDMIQLQGEMILRTFLRTPTKEERAKE